MEMNKQTNTTPHAFDGYDPDTEMELEFFCHRSADYESCTLNKLQYDMMMEMYCFDEECLYDQANGNKKDCDEAHFCIMQMNNKEDKQDYLNEQHSYWRARKHTTQKLKNMQQASECRKVEFDETYPEIKAIVDRFVKQKKMPSCKRSEKKRVMKGRNGTLFEVYHDDLSFYAGNDHKESDVYIETDALVGTDERQRAVFTFSQMEGARKLLMRPLTNYVKQLYTEKRKAKYIRKCLAYSCYSLLRSIQTELNGLAQEAREVFAAPVEQTATENVVEEPTWEQPEEVVFTAPIEEVAVEVEEAPVAEAAVEVEVPSVVEAREVVLFKDLPEAEQKKQSTRVYKRKLVKATRRIRKILHDSKFYQELEDDDWYSLSSGEEDCDEQCTNLDTCLCNDCVYAFIKENTQVHCQFIDEDEPFERYEINGQTYVERLKPRAQADIQNDVTKEENTTFTDQRNTVMDDGYITSQIEPNLKALSMQEDQWHVREIMKKPVPFVNGAWSVSDVQGKIIAQWDLPGDVLKGPHYNMAATFVFWRGHPVIRFQINGTKFHSGRLLAAFIPAFQFTQYDDKLYTIDNLLAMPHVILDAGFSNSGVLNLPFVHMNTYFNTVQGERDWQSLGRLVLVVFNKLGAASSSSQEVGYTGWVSYDNCELHQPSFAHPVRLPKANKAPEKPRAQAAIEGLVKSALPMITDMVAPGMSSIGSVIGGASNLDKPTDPIEISRWVPNAVTSLSQGTGLDKSSRLSLAAGTYTIGDADLISTTEDDMNLLMISKIPTRLLTLKWNTSKGSQQRLIKLPVCPNLFEKKQSSSKVTPGVEILSAPLLAYIARSFKYWRGSLRYKIQLIASQMHTGRLMVVFAPGVTEFNFEGASYLNTYIIDLQERHEVEFEVPFLAERPWLRCDRLRRLDVSGETETARDNFECTGYLAIYILNRLGKPDSVASEIDVNILVSAGEDFEVAVPADFACFQGIGDVINITAGSAEPHPVAQALVGQTDVSRRTDEGVISLTKGGGKLGAAAASTMSENAMDLKTLLRRYYKVWVNKWTLGGNVDTVSFANSPTLSGVNKCFNDRKGMQVRTHLSHFSELFTFWRGSLRYKFVWSAATRSGVTTPLQVKVFHIPGSFILGNFTPANRDPSQEAFISACEAYGVLVGQSSVQSSLEFEIPFYTPYTQLRCIQGTQPEAKSCTGLVVIVVEQPDRSSYSEEVYMDVALYQAGGDDFALNYLRTAPKVQFVAGTEELRLMGDGSPFLYKDIPEICPKPRAPERDSEEEEPRPTAQALIDNVPLLGDHLRATRQIGSAGAALETACNTASHIMQQAATKIGLSSGDDEEEKTEEPTLVQTVTQTAAAISDPIISIFTTLSEYLKNLPAAMGIECKYDLYDTALDVSHLILAFKSYQDSSIIMKTLAVVSIVTTLFKTITTISKNMIYRFASSVIGNLYGSRKGNELPTAEAEIFDFVAPLGATLSIAVGLLGFKSMPGDKETMDTVKSVSEKLRLFNFSSLAVSNVKALWQQLKEIFEWLTEKVVGMWSAEYLAQMKMHREFEKVEEWAAFIDELENINYEDRIHYDPEFKRRVYRAVDMGKKFNMLLAQGGFGRAANVVKEYCRKSLEICTKCDKSKNTLPFRKDPFCISMFGAPGVGKSGVITRLGLELMNQLEYPQHNRWCTINCADKFFNENYTQQTAVYFDDFSQFTSEEQYMQFFNLKSNTAYPLNMAFKKGEYFNSDFIFMTTNTSHPNPNCLTCIPALWRRRDVLIEADFIDEVREAGMRGEYVMRPDQSHARYRLIDPRQEGVVIEDWMDYRALVAELMVRSELHRTRQEQKLAADLELAGYIVPRAQAGRMRKVCLEACKNAPSLALFDERIWEYVVYNVEMELFQLDQNAPEEVMEAYAEMQASFEALGMPEDEFQRRMKQNSYEVKEKVPLITKVRGKLSDLKELVVNGFTKLCGVIPAIKTLARCAFTLAVVFFSIKTMAAMAGSVLHKCVCATARFFGYRCAICGKWPKLANCEDKEWIVEEWNSLYNEPYKDEYVTSLDEEWTIRSIQNGAMKATGIEVGTKKRAEGSPYYTETKGQAAPKILAQGRKLKMRAHAQDEHVSTLITHRVIPNTYRVKHSGGENSPPMNMCAFAIGGRMLAMPAHFFHWFKEGDYWEVYHNNAWCQVEYNEEKANKLEGKDIIIYEMPISFHLHKTMVNHFVSEKELAYGRKFPMTMVMLDSQLRTVMKEANVEPQEKIEYGMEHDGEWTEFRVQNAWKYRMQTAPGSCGAPLLAHCTKLQGRILGFHVCGNGIHGWATLITKEMIERFVTKKEGSRLPSAQAKFGNIVPQGHFGRIGKSDKIYYGVTKTEIIETAIHGEITPPVTFPAVLSRDDPRLEKRVNPLHVGIGKYSQALKPFPLQHRKLVNDYLRSELATFTRLRRPRLLTDLETVTGLPEFVRAYEPLPMNTSPGWPYINTRPSGESGKAYLFDVNGQIADDELKRRYVEREEYARRGERVESIWIDCLKDERRALPKIKSGSTRVFTIGPVDFSMLCRKYCQDFVEAIKASRGYSHCKLGIDAQSMEWTELFTYLTSFADCIVAGDFTRFDGTVHAELIEDYFDDVDEFYKEFGEWCEEDSRVRGVLADEIVNTIQLAKDEFYMTHGGNPSGNQQTTPLNSRTNFRYMALAWLGLAKHFGHTEFLNMSAFAANVRIACFGDDNLLAIKRAVIDWFNQETISWYLEEFGIVYTNETKDGITKYKAIGDCTFLKQGFAQHQELRNITVPLMKESTIMELLNWTKIAPDQDQLLEDNCTDALRFAYFYGKDYFNNLRSKIQRALEKHEKNFRLKTYCDMDQWFKHVCGML